MMDLKTYNLFIGSTTGSLKGVVVGIRTGDIATISKNLVKNKADLTNKNEITCMDWNGESENEIVIGMKNKVKIFDTIAEEFSDVMDVTDGEICGIFREQESVFVAQTSGIIKSIKSPFESTENLEYLRLEGGAVERMRRSTQNPNIIAVGGKENNLKLYDLSTRKMVFAAKNIKPDELQLQVPIWVSDIAFARQDEKVATCMRHGFVRLYDHLLPQRRPVFNAHQPDQVFTCISGTPNDKQWLVGSCTGDIILVDTRGKSAFAGKYKGCCGAVKSIVCPCEQSYVFSVSLDRHFRIHDFNSRTLLHKEYLLSRLTTILARKPFILATFETKEEFSNHKKHKSCNADV